MPTPFLTAMLYAPLASFGGLAVGERRGSQRYPTRSMLIGLLGAALGVDRADEAGQRALRDGYGFALQVFAPGRPFTDYHTAQMPSRGKTRFATRREELAAPDLNTVLTSRDYRSDFLAGLAVSATPTAPYALESVAEALRQPRYTLSLGRKSCPFGLPLAPHIADYDSARAALAALWAGQEVGPLRELSRLLHAQPGDIVLERGHQECGTVHFVRDEPLSRKRWQFGMREVVVLPGGENAS